MSCNATSQELPDFSAVTELSSGPTPARLLCRSGDHMHNHPMRVLSWLPLLAVSCTQTPDAPPSDASPMDASFPTFEASWTLTSQGVSSEHARREFTPTQEGARGLLYCIPQTLRISFNTSPHTSFYVSRTSKGVVGIEIMMPGRFCDDPTSCHFHTMRAGVGCLVRPITITRPGEIHTIELAAPCRLVRPVRFGDLSLVDGDYIDLHSLRLQFTFRHYRVEDVDSGIVDCGAGVFD
jgi:hypothetical protein